MSSAELVKVPFFKKKSRPTTSRKKESSPPPSTSIAPVASSSKTEVVLPSRKAASNILSAGSKRTSSQRNDEEMEEDERDGPDVKYKASGSHVKTALKILAGDEAEDLLAKRRRKEKADRGEEDEEVPDDGLYHGQKNYKSHLQKSKEIPKAMRVGPQRSTDNTIRTVTIVDYQPDVCKDYKGKY